MHHRRGWIVALTMLCGAVPAMAQTAESSRIAWEGEYDAAVRRAEAEGKPLFITFLQDDEPGNDATVVQYFDREIVRLSRKFVCLVGCVGDHQGEGGKCRKFPGITCAQHQAIEKKARARWLDSDEVLTPQQVFCDPKGEVLLRKVYLIPRQTLKRCLAIVLNSLGTDPDAKTEVDAETLRVDAWLKDLDSKTPEVRDAALRGLGSADDDRALPAVMQRTRAGNDDAMRLAAIAALAQKGNYLAVRPLLALLGDPKPQIAIRAALGLETVQLPAATAGLLNLLKKEKRERVRGFMLRAAARCSPGNAAVREACLAGLRGASVQLEHCLLVAMGWLASNDKIVEAVRPLLAMQNQNTRGLAVWVLGGQATAECAPALSGLQATEKSPEVKTLLAAAMKRCAGEKVEDYGTMFTPFFPAGDY